MSSTASATADFVKGHCGWDVVTLVPEGQIRAGDELSTSIKIMSPPIDGGLEVGWLGFGDRPDELTLRMVNSTTKSWISMCGGMSQVIGRALVETFLRDHFKVDVSRSNLAFKLMTPSGTVPIHVQIDIGSVSSVETVMDNYLSFVHQSGVEDLRFLDTPLMRVGKYAVLDLAVLERAHPGVDFTRRDPGPHLEIVNEILRAFRTYLGAPGVNGMLYDDRSEGPGQFRVFPRFYSDDLAAARLPWEFQCGTGSIAVAIALAREGRLPLMIRGGDVLFEWGSYRTTRDPYGIRTSRLSLKVSGGLVSKASFSHSVVEILAEGKLRLPGY